MSESSPIIAETDSNLDKKGGGSDLKDVKESTDQEKIQEEKPKSEPKKEIKKLEFSQKCSQCDHEIKTDNDDKLPELVKIHKLSHENEKQIESKEDSKNNSDLMKIGIGIFLGLVGMGIFLKIIYDRKKKTDSNKKELK